MLHEGEEGLGAVGLDVEGGEAGEVHPEELVVLPHPAQHDLQLVQVGARLAQGVQLHGVVHLAHFQHFQVGAGVDGEELLQVLGVVLVLEVQVDLGDGGVGGAELRDGGQGGAVRRDDLQLGDDAGKQNVFLFINLVVN